MLPLPRTAAAVLGALALALPFSPPAAADPATLPLAAAVDALPVAEEDRTGYDRRLFRHWIDADRDGCNTRAEVLKAEAIVPPEQSAGCRLTGGLWHSYYDDVFVDDASSLDIDHMVPLAEAWDSGASQWSPARREAFANDLDYDPSLVAVTARSNRSKGDKDPAEWMPPAGHEHCRYVEEWTAVKHRWVLTVDQAEREALLAVAGRCPDSTVEIVPAP
ncbi:HNH endonuclease [Streptomyces sp. OF3]|uniref:HNH endonuclease n=1 Tax=Streptomyces alkaliterrae TaxID=2213162 RepID=A0A7W3WHM4_9ACTN|nr:DUF1524 domain-containing protein [Streptomyces alkaliterrae]MBB1252543.1 HNH endonuclease [Streptomyces alkaliterrae]